jgi:hypothetical protein
MNKIHRMRTLITEYSVRNANRARHYFPRSRLYRMILMLPSAGYLLYYVMVTRGGSLARMAAMVLVVILMGEVWTDITRYLYLRGRRTGRSVSS